MTVWVLMGKLFGTEDAEVLGVFKSAMSAFKAKCETEANGITWITMKDLED